MATKGPYRSYNKNSSAVVPRTTGWRSRNELEEMVLINRECAQEDILEYESEPELDIPVAKRQVVDHSTCISDLDTSSNASDSEIMHTDYQISPASTPPSTPASSPDPLTLMTGANPLSPFATPTSGRSNRSTSTSHSRSVSPDPSLSLDLDEPCGDFDEPLYVESLVSKCEGWNLIMSFAIDNKLSYNAITNLLDLLYRLLPSPNKLPSSTYMLKKYYQEKKESFFKKLYCSECSEELTTEKFCSNHRCRQKRAEVCQYIGLPFEVTIRDIYEGYWEKLQYPFLRDVKENVIGDVYDGSIVKDLMKPGGFLSVPEHAALMLNTDGVQTFDSSRHSMWPVFLMLCNLPPEMRMDERFQILAGIWYGPKKPADMALVLNPVIIKLQGLLQHGIEATTPAGRKVVKAILLTGIFDLPAKAAVLNMKQFNGEYGCLYCLDPGEVISRNLRVYPYNANRELRTERGIMLSAEQAVSHGCAVEGIKGYSVLHHVINIPFGVPVDYMHCVLEGVVKSLLTLWFDSKHHSHAFSLRPWIKEIDKMLTRIKPPHDFRRSPRSIDTFKYWKASELRAFILFYALPILQSFLQPHYVYHLALLVSSMHILLGTSCEESHLKSAQERLEEFYSLIPELYTSSLCTMNVHSLIHLAPFVRLWGPLWTHSAFGYESMNGSLLAQVHGTRDILEHVVFRITLKQKISLQKHAQQADMLHSTVVTQTNVAIEGKVYTEEVNPNIAEMLEEQGIVCDTYTVFKKLKKNHLVYHSKKSVSCKRDSSICMFSTETDEVCFGQIQYFLLVTGLEPFVLVEEFKKTGCDIIQSSEHPAKFINTIIHQVKKLSLSSKLNLIKATSIISKCVLIPMKGEEYNYIVVQPNTYEHH